MTLPVPQGQVDYSRARSAQVQQQLRRMLLIQKRISMELQLCKAAK
jgi:hypothetical protein